MATFPGTWAQRTQARDRKPANIRICGQRGEDPTLQRTPAIAVGEVAMHTGRSSSPRAVRSRLPENEVTQTRSHAPVRRSTSGSSEIPGTSFRSMLKRTSGQAPSRSSMSGIGSVPDTRSAATSR